MSEQSPQGIDVSKHQGTVDWNAVRQAGKVFAFMKATEGITYTDPEVRHQLERRQGRGPPARRLSLLRDQRRSDRPGEQLPERRPARAGGSAAGRRHREDEERRERQPDRAGPADLARPGRAGDRPGADHLHEPRILEFPRNLCLRPLSALGRGVRGQEPETGGRVGGLDLLAVLGERNGLRNFGLGGPECLPGDARGSRGADGPHPRPLPRVAGEG